MEIQSNAGRTRTSTISFKARTSPLAAATLIANTAWPLAATATVLGGTCGTSSELVTTASCSRQGSCRPGACSSDWAAALSTASGTGALPGVFVALTNDVA